MIAQDRVERLEAENTTLRRQCREQAEEIAEWRSRAVVREDTREANHRVEALQKALSLPPAEARALSALLDYPGRYVSLDTLLVAIAYHEETEIHIVRVRICGLRKALLPRGLADEIRTGRNTGYLITREGAEAVGRILGAFL